MEFAYCNQWKLLNAADVIMQGQDYMFLIYFFSNTKHDVWAKLHSKYPFKNSTIAFIFNA